MSRLGIVAISSSLLGLIGTITGASPGVLAADPTTARFLDAAQWQAAAGQDPAGQDPAGQDVEWSATSVFPGRRAPDFACASEPLPPSRSSFRNSFGDGIASGAQHITRASNAAAASRLVDAFLTNLKSCQDARYSQAGGRAQVRTLGSYGVGDGLTVVGVFYREAAEGGGKRIGSNLFAVGRDGRLITTLELELPGPKADAPVAPFTAAAKKAVAGLR